MEDLQLKRFPQAVLTCPRRDEISSHRGRVHGDPHLTQEVWKAANVVLVTVSDDKREQAIAELRERLEKAEASGVSKRKVPDIMKDVAARMRANGEL